MQSQLRPIKKKSKPENARSQYRKTEKEIQLKEAFLSYDHILISKGYDDPKPHRHFAKHLIFSRENEFECIVEEKSIFCNAICIDSNMLHTVKYSGDDMLVFLFDGTSNLSKRLDEKYLKGAPYCLINKEVSLAINERWKENENDAKKLDEVILSACDIKGEAFTIYDERITHLLKKLSETECIGNDTITELCDSVYLSRSRVSHLFKKQVGISLSTYMVFEKIRKVYKYIHLGESATTASLHAGFSSSSHFSNTYKKMFGLTYSDFTKITMMTEIG